MPSEKLMPCPFCGGSIELRQMGDDKFVAILCETCQASGPNHYGQYEWNSRLTAAEQAEPVPNTLEPAEPATDAEPFCWLPTTTAKWLEEYDGPACGTETVAYNQPLKSDGGVPLFTHPPESRLREALEHVTELLVDTWNTKMEGDPERQIAVREARAALTQGADDE